MAQHDYVISNQGFASYRSDHNSSLFAIVTNNSGATEPSTTYQYQWWYDVSNDILKMRNADNDAWISMFTFDQTADTYSQADTLYVDSSNNRVGVGTDSPTNPLHIFDTTPDQIKLQNDSTDSGPNIVFANNDGNLARIASQETNTLRFDVGPSNTEAMRINENLNVGIGISSPSSVLDVQDNTGSLSGSNDTTAEFRRQDGTYNPRLEIRHSTTGSDIHHSYSTSATNLTFSIADNELMRITSDGRVGINRTSPSNRALHIGPDGAGVTGTANEKAWSVSFDAGVLNQTNATNIDLNDSSASSGTHNYMVMRFQGSAIGDIDTTDNTTIRYNTFTGGHWSQFHDGTNPELKRGTVMSLTGDKLEYSKCEKTVIDEKGIEELQKFEIAGTHEIGTEVTVPNDEYGEENSTTTATVVSNYTADHLVKVKVSDNVADKGVYGIWAGKYSDGDLSVEALGTSTIRIKQGEVLEVGDLLESAGDGTAQKQTDETIKNSTIAKVTSPIAIETFDDNSFLVSCVLYCG